jgi:hypothetical protein
VLNDHRLHVGGRYRPCAKLPVVGFNPFRQRRRSAADYLMVAAALLVCLALVLWAALG